MGCVDEGVEGDLGGRRDWGGGWTMEEKDLKQLNRSRGGGGGSATYYLEGRVVAKDEKRALHNNKQACQSQSSPPMGAAAQ